MDKKEPLTPPSIFGNMPPATIAIFGKSWEYLTTTAITPIGNTNQAFVRFIGSAN